MSRARRNRRRKAPVTLPSLPSIRFRLNWRVWLLPPLTVMLLVAAADVGSAWVDRPVTDLTVEGEFERVRPIDIEAALGSVRSRRFFTLDLAELRDAVAALDWVDRVEVRRIWPGEVFVRVTEHRAAASWGETGLLNTRGELFAADARFAYAELPRLDGPPGSERRVAALYLDIRERLATVNLALTTLTVDARGALSFALATGQEIRIGRDAYEARLDRFFDVAIPALATEFEGVRYVDLRYPNGFAVGWLEKADAAEQLDQADGSDRADAAAGAEAAPDA